MTSFRTLGDLSTSFLLSRQTQALKAEVQRRSTELSSGQTADLSRALRGDYRALGAVSRGLALSETERITIAEARGFATAAQAALGVVQDQTEALTSVLLAVPHAPTLTTLARAGSTARQGFEAVVGVLNQRTADRAIFAGDATDAAALAPVDSMLAEIEALVASETTAAGVVAAVDAWFDSPGAGFELTGYIGSGIPLAPFRLGAGEAADLAVTAADPGLRDMLKGFALGALLDGPTLSGDAAEREALARAAADRTLAATDRITDLRAGIGAAEAAVEAASVRRETETAALELARAELIGADPFEAATRLETAQTRLETLYALTARVSRLSLVDFLR
jgi:flagellar hook-associated protein 3 FlgL